LSVAKSNIIQLDAAETNLMRQVCDEELNVNRIFFWKSTNCPAGACGTTCLTSSTRCFSRHNESHLRQQLAISLEAKVRKLPLHFVEEFHAI